MSLPTLSFREVFSFSDIGVCGVAFDLVRASCGVRVLSFLEKRVNELPEVPVGDHGVTFLWSQLLLGVQLGDGFVDTALGICIVNTQDVGCRKKEPVGGSYELCFVNGLERARERGPEVDPTLLCSRPLVNEGLEIGRDFRLAFDPDALSSVGKGSEGGRFDAAVGVRSNPNGELPSR